MTYFTQACPKCSRNLKIRVSYLGKQVVCQHCESQFEANDRDPGEDPSALSGITLIERADEILSSVGDLRSTEDAL